MVIPEQKTSPQEDTAGTTDSSNSDDSNKELKKKIDDLIIKVGIISDDVGKVRDTGINMIEVLGVFVALFTFISMEFQVFRIYHDLAAIVGLTAIILGSLLIFVSVLDIILRREFSLINGIFLLLSIILLVFGMLIFSRANEPDYIKDLEDVQKRIFGLEEAAKSQGKESIDLNSEIKVLQDELNNFRNDYKENSQEKGDKLIELEVKTDLLEEKLNNLNNDFYPHK